MTLPSLSIQRRCALGLLAASLLLAGCGGEKNIVRPAGSLGDSVNSAGDEFAPTLRPDRGGLYFTSNRRATDDIWRVDVVDPTASDPVWPGASLDRSDLSRLSQSTTNDGAATFVTPTAGFFASGHAPDTLYTRPAGGGFGGIVGGTDLFEFRVDGLRPEVTNLGPAVNSKFWESHPTAVAKGDTVMLIFSSDRPAEGKGFSAPYQGAASLDPSNKVVRGNADLYVVFRIGGVWGPVTNLASAQGARDLNTPSNEYSPFLFCADQHPRLFFASNRGGDYDIYEAELTADFARGTVTIGKVTALEKGAEAINTDDDEFFPYLTPYAEGRGQYLYLSSNRNREGRRVGEKTVQSSGGFDLYRFPLKRECRAPQLRLEITVLDAENPSRPVVDPVVNLYAVPTESEVTRMPATTPILTSGGSTAVFNVPYGTEYAAFGGSRYNQVNCADEEGRVTGYYFVRVEPGVPTVTSRVEYEWRDTLEGRRRVTTAQEIVVDTLTLDELQQLSSTPGSIIEAVERSGDAVVVTRRVRWDVVRMDGGTLRRYKARVVRYDTTMRFDTLVIATPGELAPSERTVLYGNEFLPPSGADVTIRDTIYVLPRYYRPPLCEWLYTRDVRDYGRNVPYFQTAFWEVNTEAGLRSQMGRFAAGKEMADASFIELHPHSQYFGVERGEARRGRRIEEYRGFARTVDRNLDRMARAVADTIIPSFLAFDSANPGANNRLVIQINAYSDIRSIERGWYSGSETVRYVAGWLDTRAGSIALEDVEVRPGASLVSQNNDTLSKLRAWFGYRELLNRLERSEHWSRLVAQGAVVLPNEAANSSAYRAALNGARIIVLVGGLEVDTSQRPDVEGYAGKRDEDYYSLDDVRRIDVRVNRMEWVNGKLVVSSCCVPR